jgi:hypothetical protein
VPFQFAANGSIRSKVVPRESLVVIVAPTSMQLVGEEHEIDCGPTFKPGAGLAETLQLLPFQTSTCNR